jgi:hypothetical protein
MIGKVSMFSGHQELGINIVMPYLAFENKMDSEASKSKGNTLRLCRNV